MSLADSSNRDSNPAAGILSAQGLASAEESSFNLLQLPDVSLGHVLSFLSFDEVTRIRIVSKGFNRICSNHLNRTFDKIRRRTSAIDVIVKKSLPKRLLLQRRHHPMAKTFWS